MIAKGKSISHGTASLEYDLAKEINGEAAATEIPVSYTHLDGYKRQPRYTAMSFSAVQVKRWCRR